MKKGNFVMPNLYVVLGILVFMVAGFMIGKWSFGLTSMTCVILLFITGQVSLETAFSGFAMKNLVFIAGIYMVSAAFGKTSFIGKVQGYFMRLQGSKSSIFLVSMLILLVAFLAQFMSASVVITTMIMVLSSFSQEGDVTPSRMLLPMALMGCLWQDTWPVGQYFGYMSAFNQQISSYDSPMLFQTLDIFKVLIFPLLACCAYIMLTYKWLPKRDIDESKLKKTKEVEAIPHNHEVLIYIVFIVVALSMFLNMFIGDYTYIIPVIGAVILIYSGALKDKEAKAVLGSDLLFMLAGVFVMANAIADSGAGMLIGETVLKALGSNPGGLTIMFAFGGVSIILTQFMSNSGSRNVLLPMAIATCIAAGYDPRGVICVVELCCACAVLLPTASPSAAIAYAAAGYKIKETFLFSILLMVVCLVTSVLSANFFFPVFG
jgi:di/tricarboxylate transporter